MVESEIRYGTKEDVTDGGGSYVIVETVPVDGSTNEYTYKF